MPVLNSTTMKEQRGTLTRYDTLNNMVQKNNTPMQHTLPARLAVARQSSQQQALVPVFELF